MSILPNTIGAGCGVMIFNDKNQLLLGLKNENKELADSELHEGDPGVLRLQRILHHERHGGDARGDDHGERGPVHGVENRGRDQ